MKIALNVEIRDFTVPNFVTQVLPAGKKEDGIQYSGGIPLKELRSETLDQLCRNFRRSVFQKAEQQDPEDRK